MLYNINILKYLFITIDSDLNKKIEEILNEFRGIVQKASDIKDKQIAELLESVETEYVEKIKNDIKL